MQLSVEISKYPLVEVDFVTAIQNFIDRINQYDDIRVVTNVMSTQLFGDYDVVMNALTTELKTSFEKYGTTVFACKFIPGNLYEKYAD
ncbi:hypothetical protein GCM10008107_30620 [Psychrosphaera saromensis]|jgi:uncharacterized protein YqgV (UPF0045/DUF77 family)|uniref:Thiamin/hydroxymethyl pyrimidine-binding YkoF putative domain-containing protein n=1 Tax=Psychrosphaera saromensis TaxID=716813 RepID=A0A2S7UT29_9GAMM|nr:hypothetical protein [Psychrosphaera saromensis]PQJ52899.1 hypothetical protein BTO11_04015 [Psychrosphaera saromensis]GHB78937.1 hypothetical protein GCM10008107_30620 [Psychrosphaera saromensis]GLQ14644.1 hypothetical protein GCM10007917_20990 [Psychrosphaera saromensis]